VAIIFSLQWCESFPDHAREVDMFERAKQHGLKIPMNTAREDSNTLFDSIALLCSNALHGIREDREEQREVTSRTWRNKICDWLAENGDLR
jgi:hypothetical protein